MYKSQGAAGEVDTLLSFAQDLSCFDKPTGEKLSEQLNEIGKMLTGLTKSLRTSF